MDTASEVAVLVKKKTMSVKETLKEVSAEDGAKVVVKKGLTYSERATEKIPCRVEMVWQ